MKHIAIFSFACLFSLFAKGQEITGSWTGPLKVQGISLTINIHIVKEGGELSSTFDSPDQGAFGLAFDRTTFDQGKLICHAPAMGLIYEAMLDGAILKGHWSQGGQKFPLDLHRGSEGVMPSRPQMPVKPYPYREVEVEVKRPDVGIVLRGTLTIPAGDGPFPAAVLISGSGPQNRDLELLGHSPFLVLADHLTRRGVAVLRYDDRGTAASTGDFQSATSADFAEDAEAVWDFLRSQEAVQADRVGFIGLSEGGLIAPMIAARNGHVGFVVMMAGPTIPGDALLLAQTEAVMQAQGEKPSEIASALKVNGQLYAWLAGHETVDEAAGDFDRFLASVLEEFPQHDEALNSARAMVETPWFHYFMRYDPLPALREMDGPALALFGGKDTQVPAEVNAVALRPWFEEVHDQRIIRVFDQCNHLFQTADTGAPKEYVTIEETMAPEVMEFIANWILSL